ncbi:MAG: hypothetical protein EBU82_09595 [Flavobacteriia bacterium]|nr:hypothetical protein [Flavobacteriia bacterium]
MNGLKMKTKLLLSMQKARFPMNTMKCLLHCLFLTNIGPICQKIIKKPFGII